MIPKYKALQMATRLYLRTPRYTHVSKPLVQVLDEKTGLVTLAVTKARGVTYRRPKEIT